MLAVAAAAAAGHRVLACTRKPLAAEALRGLGAAEVIAPDEAVAPGAKPLASGRYTAVIDTVGGSLLANLLRSVRPGGAVASIGNAGGVAVQTTVLPFILRGVTLTGIDAAGLLSNDQRRQLWPKLAALWPRVEPHYPVRLLELGGAGDWACQMLAGETHGRAVLLPPQQTDGD
jgi:acrylyl-CoA reductase (NADPH)